MSDMTKPELKEAYNKLQKDYKDLDAKFRSYHRSLNDLKNEKQDLEKSLREEQRKSKELDTHLQQKQEQSDKFTGNNQELLEMNRFLNEQLNKYRNAYTSFMQAVQGSLSNSIELETVYAEQIKNYKKEGVK